MGLIRFINNLRYLARYDIKKLDYDLDVTKSALDYMKYELKEDLPNLVLPTILNAEQTVEYLLKTNKSIARFGDGEILLLRNNGISFQSASPLLAERLAEVLTTRNENIEIGLFSSIFRSTKDMSSYHTDFVRRFWGKNADWLLEHLDITRTYLSTEFTILPDNEDKINRIRLLWKDKDITVICGDRVVKNVEYNVFDCAKSIEYIFAPTVNAFNKYDEILEKAKQIPKDRLVCIILGPTATVLAYDLTLLGYRALDMGHIVKSYDFFYKNNKSIQMSSGQFAKFFAKD